MEQTMAIFNFAVFNQNWLIQKVIIMQHSN